MALVFGGLPSGRTGRLPDHDWLPTLRAALSIPCFSLLTQADCLCICCFLFYFSLSLYSQIVTVLTLYPLKFTHLLIYFHFTVCFTFLFCYFFIFLFFLFLSVVPHGSAEQGTSETSYLIVIYSFHFLFYYGRFELTEFILEVYI
jgi:hypothetical protein